MHTLITFLSSWKSLKVRSFIEYKSEHLSKSLDEHLNKSESVHFKIKSVHSNKSYSAHFQNQSEDFIESKRIMMHVKNTSSA